MKHTTKPKKKQKEKLSKPSKNVGSGAGQPIQIEWQEPSSATYYDESNPLIIVPKKNKNKDGGTSDGHARKYKSKATPAPTKLLSKKQRKKLEKIVERREKKKNRAELIDELQKHQLPQEIFNRLTPLVKIQTEGIRKLFMDELAAKTAAEANSGGPKKVNSIKGAYKKKRLAALGLVKPMDPRSKTGTKRNLNVLGFEESSSSSEEESDNDEVVELGEVKEEKPDPVPSEPTKAEVEILKTATEPTPPVTSTPPKPTPKKAKVDSTPETEPAKTVPRKPSKFVTVNRAEAVIRSRSKLPIIPEESVIMEAITANPVVVLAGETGCGKTTQVPQFLYEAGYAEPSIDSNGQERPRMIGVTEPRRVAAMAMSSRVGAELNLGKHAVSYQIRFEGNTSPETRIKFMTDGVLLKEMEADFLLNSYSVICIDEAHERSLYTDILIGLLSRAVRLRAKRGDPLKLVIMSATLKAEEFLQNRTLFKTSPAFIHVPARQFPVRIHFSKRTPENYLDAARRRVTAIHNRLPPGGILVFVTGQLEVKQLATKLNAICSAASAKGKSNANGKELNVKKRKRAKPTDESEPAVTEFDLDKINEFPEEADEMDEEGENEDEEMVEEDESEELITEPLHIVPLYSMLPMRDQRRVFQPPPEGHRLCVIATNVAETSLTIPSTRYVVDCGKVKEKWWDKLTGVQGFRVAWCSKASAEQRAGRAGRTGPGHCYRLYSSAVYDSEFPAHAKPEILLRPVDDMVLLMKSMSITKVRHFPYPTAPDHEQIEGAEKLLTLLGAIESSGNSASSTMEDAVITPLGKTMARLPVNPRFSKMLALAATHGVLQYVVALVAALSVQEVLLEGHENPDAQNRWTALRKKWVEKESRILLGDAMVLLAAISAFETTDLSPESAQQLGVRHKAMVEIQKLRKQLANEIQQLGEEKKPKKSQMQMQVNMDYKPPDSTTVTTLRQIILSGCPDKIAKRLDPEELAHAKLKSKHAAYWIPDMEEPAFLHSASVLKGLRPEYIVFQEAFEAGGKVFLRGITSIESTWIPEICPQNSVCGVKVGR